MRRILVLLVVPALAGCLSGRLDYSPPTMHAVTNVALVAKPRDEVWNALIPLLGQRFFVINNLDKGSGLVNLSYTGDPQAYVDCGFVTSVVSNARGERTYSFPGASASESYEFKAQNQLVMVRRAMKLEGRMNLILEEMGPKQTRVTANTRYVVNRDAQMHVMGAPVPVNRTDSIAFSTGDTASFPRGQDGRSLDCRSTGRLETEVLSLVK